MILIYLIFFFLVLRFTVTLFNFLSNPKLTNSFRQYDDFVSILIPARNEEADIQQLLHSISIQNYQNYEVIILDDNSTDRTSQVCQDFCDQHKRFKLLPGAPLPKGWLGKNFACFQLAKAAHGKYLIFLDADETISDGLINNSIHRMKLKIH